MGWYYDAPFDTLREEDALSYLAWMRYGVPIEEEYGMLSEEDINQLRSFDLPLLLNKVNYGKSLPLRGDDEEPLSVMRFNCEPLRYRHKPILFYGIIHSIGFLLHKVLEVNGFKYVPAVNSKKDLAYWYRLPEPQVSSTDRMNTDDNDDTTTTTTMDPPLVFAHGIGGLAFCYKLIDDLLHDKTVKDKTPIILMDLPHISLRIHDDIPQIKSQVESICKIIDNVVSRGSGSGGEAQAQGQGSKSPNKATFVGHSFGTLLLSWMVQSNPERVAGCVFLDPICFNLHLKDILFNFHMQRVDERVQAGKEWNNPLAMGSLIDLAGTEMHTNTATLRQFSWASNSLWPEDLKKNDIPATIILTENDAIVPTAAVEELFSDFNSKNRKTDQSPLVNTFKGVDHGEMFMIESLRKDTARMVLNMMEKSRKSAMYAAADPISLIKKEYRTLIDDTAGEFWDQIKFKLTSDGSNTSESAKSKERLVEGSR